jgi:hypothetical protein
MRVLILLFVACSCSFLLNAQSKEKDDYAILEVVIRKENAISLYQQVNNQRFLSATDSLREFTGGAGGKINQEDTIIHWDEASRLLYFSQLSAAPVNWNKRKIYFCTVLEEDVIGEIDRGGQRKEEILDKDKTYQIHRISQPLYLGESAMVYVEFEMLGVLDHEINFRKGHRGLYFLKAQKGKWKIYRYVGQVSN